MRDVCTENNLPLSIDFHNIFHPHSTPPPSRIPSDDDLDQMDVDALYTTTTQKANPSHLNDTIDDYLPMDWEDWTAAQNMTQNTQVQYIIPRNNINSTEESSSGMFRITTINYNLPT